MPRNARQILPFPPRGADAPGQLAAPPPRLPGDLLSISIQPHPASTRVARLAVRGRVVSAVARTWGEGDPGRCRLCDRCDAADNHCMVLLDGHVGDDEAPLFDSRGIPVEAESPESHRGPRARDGRRP